jgi:polyhydroxyalkanoate synthesis regulator phasin
MAKKSKKIVENLVDELTAIGALEVPQGSNAVTEAINKAIEEEEQLVEEKVIPTKTVKMRVAIPNKTITGIMTQHEPYKIVEETETHVKIIEDDGYIFQYDKKFFIIEEIEVVVPIEEEHGEEVSSMD